MPSQPLNLDELLAAVKAGKYHDDVMHELPVFGGSEPRDTSGIWSWDETRLLVGTWDDDMKIVPRDER